MASIIASAILLSGCGEDKTEAKMIEKNTTEKAQAPKNVQAKKEETKVTYTKYDSIVHQAFQDTAKVGPEGKPMVMVFGTNTDPYTDRLKADIKGSDKLMEKLQNEFSSFYFKAHENLRHKLFHENEYMDVDTKTMIAIYGINATPTIIFADTNGKAIIVVPGYMPANQFIQTMNFIQAGLWKGKDRKNGEVYEALRDYYINNGIDVRKKDNS
jgi:thioredoxin-related protein